MVLEIMYQVALSACVLIVSSFLTFHGVKHRRYSTLYWLSLIAVFSLPALLDSISGLPSMAFDDFYYWLFPHISRAIFPALLFALIHISATATVYFIVLNIGTNKKKPLSYLFRFRLRPWVIRSKIFLAVFGFTFLVSSAIILWRRADLSRQFNDFLELGTSPTYEYYFYFASTPLIAVLLAGKKRTRWVAWPIALFAFVVSYFVGIRYFMFPFLGYLVFSRILESKLTFYRRILLLGLAMIIGWVSLTFWGIIRATGTRASPSQVFERMDSRDIADRVVVGNELTARLAYYDLMMRLSESGFHRGLDTIRASVLAPVYPFILKRLGIDTPLSNSKLTYEIQTGVVGTGVSTGALAFGNDWLSFGWYGAPLGGCFIGLLLGILDLLHRDRRTTWYIIGPMSTYQLIFFARGGTDVWLGLWGRFIPISLGLIFVVYAIEAAIEKITMRRTMNEDIT